MSNPIFEEIARRVGKAERSLRNMGGDVPPFDLDSEAVMALITASQNDYELPNTDVVYVSSNLACNITGFSGGRKGRHIEIWNSGGYVFTILHQSSLSVPYNRILSYTGASLTLSPNMRIVLYYDITIARWRYGG